jgi:hypothetical protein
MRLFFEKERKGRYFTWFEGRIFLNLDWLDVKSNNKIKKNRIKKVNFKKKLTTLL